MLPLRTIVCGAGSWGKHWIETICKHPRMSLVAVVARTQATLDSIAGDYGISPTALFADLALAIKAVEAELVVVVTPPTCHLEHIQAALQAGLHVICEKPLADSWDAAQRIAEIVRSYPQQKFMVSQTRRFTDQLETIRKVIASGKIGQLDMIAFDHRVNYTGGGFKQAMDFPVVEDMICHHLDGLRYITGQEAVCVYAEAWNPVWSQFSGRASNNVLITMTNGLHVNYFGTWTARGQLNDYDGVMKVMGSLGSLDLVDRDTLKFYPNADTDTGPNPEPEAIPILPLESREIEGVIEAFLQALDADVQPPCNIDDNLKTFVFNCAVLKSCRTNKQIDVQQILGDLV